MFPEPRRAHSRIVEWSVRKLALDLRWYDTDSHALGENYDGRLVGALTFAL